jgi:hypothetical protein
MRGGIRDTVASVGRIRVVMGGAVVLLFGVAATWLVPSCSFECRCGASEDDALELHDLDHPGPHTLADGCACRCGDGPLTQWAYDDDGTCEHEQTVCADADGDQAELVCDS